MRAITLGARSIPPEKKSIFHVQGMDCEDEVKAVRLALLAINGVQEVACNLVGSQIVVSHAETVDSATLSQAIQSAGLIMQTEKDSSKVSVFSFTSRFGVVASSGFFLVLAFLCDRMISGSGWVARGFYVTSMISGGLLIAPKAIRAIKNRSLDMNVLMSIAVIGAVGIGEYQEAATVIFLFSLAEWLEGFSLDRARRSIQSLLKIVPERAWVKKPDGSLTEVTVDSVEVGTTIRVLSGARIPLDGVVELGFSSVNQAPITGESLPVEKRRDDSVLAGTINGDGSLNIRVTHNFRDTKLAHIIKRIEEAQKERAPIQRFVDVFARYYTPIVFTVACVVAIIPPLFFDGTRSDWLYRALVLLVIACPCALVIATPVSIVAGLTAMAKKGILVKGGATLEMLGSLKAIAVDKTGTITEGKPKVVQIYSLNEKNESEILAIAASIDSHSSHPLARSVVIEATNRGISIPDSVEYRSLSGIGAESVIDDHVFFVGNHRYAHDHAICSNELESLIDRIESQSLSVVVVGHRPHLGCPGEIFGVLALGDSVRIDSLEAISELHRAGVKKVVMLSGDHQRTVKSIAQAVGIDEAHGDLLPDDKVTAIRQLREKFGKVAMIGDGVNDAPAMATATIGIAMGASGTDTAIETADVALMHDRLSGVADAIVMGRKTLMTIRLNIGFALTTKLLFLILSFAGYSTLWGAIAADTGATLVVIGNALFALRSREPHSP